MVKIGRWTLFERTSNLREQFRGSVDLGYGARKERVTFSVGEHSWQKRCEHFDQLSRDYPLFNQSCLSLAGLVMSQGLWLSPAVNRQDETYALAEEAVYQIDKLHKKLNPNTKFYETVYRLAKFGSAFWEITTTPTFDFRLAPFQECIEPATATSTGEIDTWRQIINNVETARWPSQPSETYLVQIAWNITSATWPYGTSLGVGSETELEALITMESNAKDYMEKQAWPYEVLQLGDEKSGVNDAEYGNAKKEWKNRKPGEGIVARNMPVAIVPGGTGSAPIRELAVLCELMKDNVHDGLMVPPISKLYNSTEASATVMTRHIMTTLGQPIQWILKEVYEEQVLKPYLESIGFSRKSCPKLLFESPDVFKKEEFEAYAALVQNKIQTPEQACEHLGLEYDEAFWREEERKQQEQFQQRAAQNQKQMEKPKEMGESWVVTKLNPDRQEEMKK